MVGSWRMEKVPVPAREATRSDPSYASTYHSYVPGTTYVVPRSSPAGYSKSSVSADQPTVSVRRIQTW